MPILDVKTYAEEILDRVKKDGTGGLFVIYQFNNNPASDVYVRNKIKACEKVGIEVVLVKTGKVPSNDFKIKINENAPTIIQLPIERYNATQTQSLLDRVIKPAYDVDGLTGESKSSFYLDTCLLAAPCTPLGIYGHLKRFTNVEGRHCLVIGRSDLVGRPMQHLLNQLNATITVVNSHTDLSLIRQLARQAEIIISASGKNPSDYEYLLNSGDVQSDAIIYDVATIRNAEGKLVGNVNPECREKAYVTPVPGGVGPLTVATIVAKVKAMNAPSLTYTDSTRKLIDYLAL